MASGGGGGGSRRVMVAVDMTYTTNRVSATALQYALSHAVLENDILFLLFVYSPNYAHIIKPFHANAKILFKNKTSRSTSSSSPSAASGGDDGDVDDDDVMEQVKKICNICKPRIEIVTEKMEIRDDENKGSVILSASRNHGIELLIIGQKRSISNAILGPKRGGASLTGFDTAEFLIKNCKCTCVAVQKKGKNAGYLLNTKTYRNFWLLA